MYFCIFFPQTDKRVDVLDERIRKLDGELGRCKQQMSRMRPGPGQNGVKQRALKLLKQKKMYEQQRDQLMGQSFTLEQTNMMAQGMKDTVTIIESMREANTAIKTTMKSMSIDDVESLHDEMEDLYDTSNEIQEVLSRSYGMPEEVDEADLEQELAALGDELDWGQEEAVPSYLAENIPVPSTEPGAAGVDSYGLPSVPSEPLQTWQ